MCAFLRCLGLLSACCCNLVQCRIGPRVGRSTRANPSIRSATDRGFPGPKLNADLIRGDEECNWMNIAARTLQRNLFNIIMVLAKSHDFRRLSQQTKFDRCWIHSPYTPVRYLFCVFCYSDSLASKFFDFWLTWIR